AEDRMEVGREPLVQPLADVALGIVPGGGRGRPAQHQPIEAGAQVRAGDPEDGSAPAVAGACRSDLGSIDLELNITGAAAPPSGGGKAEGRRDLDVAQPVADETERRFRPGGAEGGSLRQVREAHDLRIEA